MSQDRDSGMSGDAPSGENVQCSPVKLVSRKNSWNRISAKYMKLSIPYWLVSSNNKMVGELNL